jgi:UDP-N-acetylmuramoyl-tripeptide--D-alanyl-D-alanine ligase
MRTDCDIASGDLVDWTSGRWLDTPPAAVSGISLDSRAVTPGDMFVALPGTAHDGHGFIRDASNRGATAAVVARSDAGMELPRLLVRDTLEALSRLASHWRAGFPGSVAALTGSVGKTTVKDMAAAILTEAGPTAATAGNFNNSTGVPLTLLSLRSHHRFAVVEIGMSFAGEIRALVPLVRPQVGAVTNVRPVHLENFSNLSEIARAKAEILDGIQPDGVAVLNADDQLVRSMALRRDIRRITFGMDPSASVRLSLNARTGVDFQTFSLCWGGTDVPVTLRVPGAHNRMNAAAAAAIAIASGATADHVARGLAAFEPSPLRSRLVRLLDGSIILEDCYNASPDALMAALCTIAELPVAGRRVVAMADMRELGASSAEYHREIGARAAALGIGMLLGFGPLSGHTVQEYSRQAPHGIGVHVGTAEEMIDLLIADHRHGDVILVKGSRAMRLERVSAAVIARFSPAPHPDKPSTRGT